MNRLIIIGNGFDLAHRLKTSYKDFIADYFYKALNFIVLNRPYSDELITLKVKEGNYYYSDPINKITPDNSIDYIKNILEGSTILSLEFKSLILKRSFDKIEKMNWVDLEIEYFNVLLETKNNTNAITQIEAIQTLNSQLDFLKYKLTEYLNEQESQFTNENDLTPLVGCFTEIIQSYEVVTMELGTNERPKNLFFLNFNYTNIFEAYYDACRKIIPSEFDYIHGNLTGTHGNPIFGFGDELDKRYLEFEEEKNNELFKHIKSFEYLKTKNYYRLIRFLESDKYQVQIFGHSCGLSDRTMLNNIFEHENCKSIKIFYHEREDGSIDYTEKTYEISRHFKDKGLMRKKIIPLDYSVAMPQPN